jgi:hypothetical protein
VGLEGEKRLSDEAGPNGVGQFDGRPGSGVVPNGIITPRR